MTDPLPPGSTIGILGGGQLGRMLALAAARLGMKSHIFCPDVASPAFEVTPHRTIAAYDDESALAAFADAVDVVTYEFENVPARTAEFIAARKPLRPGARALAVSQDRLEEKGFLSESGVPVAPYRPIYSLDDLEAALAELGTPAVLKTTRLGYDGKGQRIIRSINEAAAAFDALEPKPLVLEGFIAFDKEISVIAARNAQGETRHFEPSENVHRDHILKTSTVPGNISPALAAKAGKAAQRIVETLDYVGVMGIEFFVLPGGEDLLVNEIAPRVHNSGHWTEAVCVTDQFEQHIRAVVNWPLGDVTRTANVVMENLIGHEADSIVDLLGPGVRPHLYGKIEARPGRKMGHINRIGLKTGAK
ncbi:5-(carboxyamino)imidazole ribonucleotide synthase [Paradevosia shaoguanensis]|uniref:N5-carboxyaminoimidazole ribonucleotide synthase n=1 Tax=Paradevosia shaoguanensis TaxID=1335043 RepID=A0AA41UCA2_9HYPH|nr:5-(carboxyamino)imidazole ribonucleotide synthase [Paradevosia shaoguanensis]MCF1743642.1 5-(carboxyamino)imidazole ribonucleotide synthase [Paradevosia shaoguanensis]MCI0128125.1 5-(carboxyamino)imidazole ribonucleotide synthase [Paradevosia shaoguanensis]